MGNSAMPGYFIIGVCSCVAPKARPGLGPEERQVAQVTAADGLVHPPQPDVATGWRVVGSAMSPGWLL
jgi:hypothetical protein